MLSPIHDPKNACQSPNTSPSSTSTSGRWPWHACPSISSVDRILCARNLDRCGMASLPSPCNRRVAPHVIPPSRPNRLGHRRSLRRSRSCRCCRFWGRALGRVLLGVHVAVPPEAAGAQHVVLNAVLVLASAHIPPADAPQRPHPTSRRLACCFC